MPFGRASVVSVKYNRLRKSQNRGATMKHINYRRICYLSLATLISVAATIRITGGVCAVSEGSLLPSEDGCMLAFVYNQERDNRLVVLDEKNRRRYEAPLDEPK